MHDVVRVLLDAVVHGTEAARARAFVVHAQSAADVEYLDVGAVGAELGVVPRRLAHAELDVLDVGDLRTHVEVHHLQRRQKIRRAQTCNRVQHLARG